MHCKIRTFLSGILAILTFSFFHRIKGHGLCVSPEVEATIVSFRFDAERKLGKPLPTPAKVMYYLFTPRNRNTGQQINDCSIQWAGNFDPRLETKVIIHGYLDSIFLEKWETRMKDRFMDIGDYNVILMNWSFITFMIYPITVIKSLNAAISLARLLACLKTCHGLQYEDVHIIGHSIGAHVGGNVGRLLGNELGRVSAMDPAGPLQANSLPPALRLDRNDALFVDAIHCNALLYGTPVNVGDIDFYPNGGTIQPNCIGFTLKNFANYTLYEVLGRVAACYHLLCTDYFIYTIDRGIKCVGYACSDFYSYLQGQCKPCFDPANCAPMGFPSIKYAPFAHKNDGTKRFFVKVHLGEQFSCS